MGFLRLIGLFALLSAAQSAAAFPLVRDGEPAAAIVIPGAAHPIATYAAEEFALHVEKASGARLPILVESDAVVEGPAVYIGATRAAANAGLDVAALPGEGAYLKRIGAALYIAGADGPGDALSTGNVHSGTLWGVYEALERITNVRWLWPGDLGTFVPEASSLEVPAFDEVVAPRFTQRQLRPSINPNDPRGADERLAFSPEARQAYAHDQTVFLRRHRMGTAPDTFHSERSFGSGHAFEGWWEKYGENHPEWFHLLPDGKRGPADPNRPHKVSMCVSNPELAREVVARWQEERAKNPGVPLNIGIGENDDSAHCQCAECVAWDGPKPDPAVLPAGLERSFEPVQAGRRYALFAKRVHELAAAIDPDVQVHYYAYLNYFWAPSDVTLHPNIVIGFVPWFRWAGWFPRSEAEHQWIKDQWIGWQKTGVTAYYRPNWFLDGYTMPHLYTRQFADAFQFYARNGMDATDFDSLQGMWAAQGPLLYTLARLHTRPDADLNAVLDEFYGAYGPAGEAMRAYFGHWEAYSAANRENAANAIRSRDGGVFRRYANYARAADELYPPSVFEPAFALLDAADAAATGADPQFAARIAFHREGLRHAQACIEAAAVMNDESAAPAARAAALQRLAAYRRSVESMGIANMDRAGLIETQSWGAYPGFKEPWTP